jgi:hypothetical protein
MAKKMLNKTTVMTVAAANQTRGAEAAKVPDIEMET